ncbi:MAG TPA: AsmA-like C-terminal region-containing protein [Bacteroidia bacterium]|nr:AsmA-like C-terminal region-containing protein [Bacteroidia bacterium]
MKKIIRISLIVIIVLIGVIVAIPFVFKDKILSAVKDEINNNIRASVDFNDFDITIFSSFPDLTIKLGNLSVVNQAPFEGDTLAAMDLASVTLDIMSVINGETIRIKGVELKRPRIRLLVLENGQANWDITKPSTDSTSTDGKPSKFKAGLDRYGITDGYVYYNDRSLGFSTELIDLNHSGKGDFTSDLFTLSTHTTVGATNLTYGGIPYIYKAHTAIEADLSMDMAHSKYTFKKNSIKLNELQFGVDGFVEMPSDDITMDLKWNVQVNDFKNFMSMIPGVYRDGFNNVKSKGRLAMDGTIKGIYNEHSMPGFTLNLLIADGMFQYPDLPTALNNVQVSLNVSNPDGVPDHTIIDLSRMHVEMAGDPFDARLVVKTPVSDADIDARLEGKIDLSSISHFVPLEQGTVLKGLLQADVTAKGRMSAIESKKYEQFNAAGTLTLKDIEYSGTDFPDGIKVGACELIFNPKNVTLNSFDMQYGKTDIRATGWVDNLIAYTFKENQLLSGTLDIKSNVIDINQLSGNSTDSASADTAAMSVVEVPGNIDFTTTISAGKVYYDNMVLENLKGNISVRDRSLGINGLSFGMLEGTISMNGLYDTRNLNSPGFFFDLGLKQLDIRKTYDTFVAVQKMAPVAQRCNGKFSSDLKVRGTLDKNMNANLQSLTGGGKLTTSNVYLENFPPLLKVADALKMDQFKKMDVSNLNLSYTFENGRVSVAPFDMNIAGIKTTTQGSSGFDQTIDYTMDLKIPTAMMGGAATGVMNNLLAQANKAGANLSVGKEVPVAVKIGGTVNQPTVGTNLSSTAASVTDDLKQQAIKEFEQKKKELEDQARAEAERLKKEAEDKAKAEADRLKKEAEEKAKQEVEKQKKELEEKIKKEAEDKLKNLFGKPK